MSETTTGNGQAYGRQIPEPDPLLVPMSTREAAAQIAAESGRSPQVAEAMLRAYLDDVSAEIGVPVHQWGLDAADVAEAQRRFEWVDFEQRETVDAARQRAAREAAGWTAAAARVDRGHAPGHAARIDQEVEYWTERAHDPRQHDDDDQDEAADEDEDEDGEPDQLPLMGRDPLDAARQACTVLPAQTSVAAALDDDTTTVAGYDVHSPADVAGEAAAR